MRPVESLAPLGFRCALSDFTILHGILRLASCIGRPGARVCTRRWLTAQSRLRLTGGELSGWCDAAGTYYNEGSTAAHQKAIPRTMNGTGRPSIGCDTVSGLGGLLAVENLKIGQGENS